MENPKPVTPLRLHTTAPATATSSIEDSPQKRKIAPSMNLIKAVADNGVGQMEAIDIEIKELEDKLFALRADRNTVQQLYDIAIGHKTANSK